MAVIRFVVKNCCGEWEMETTQRITAMDFYSYRAELYSGFADAVAARDEQNAGS